MALWKLSESIPVNYHDCEERPCTHSDPLFCTGIKEYSERLASNYPLACHFFYYPAEDRYHLEYPMDYCYDTGMRRVRWGINANGQESAVILGEGIYFGFELFVQMAKYGVEVGSYKKLYCTIKQLILGDGAVGEIDAYTLSPISGGWYCLFSSLPQLNPYYVVQSPAHSIVNLEDGIIMLNMNGSPIMQFWDIKSEPHIYLGKMTAPGNVSDVSYEDRYRFWVVTQNGYIQKINYHLLRTELLSEVPDRDPTDLNYLIAWDQKRFRLAVFRHKPDAANGACTSTLEFYRPLPKAELLTDPVPIKPLRYGKRIPFSFHLVGTAGEGIAPYMVEAELEAPVEGYLERSSMGTGQYGIGGAEYVAPDQACDETLRLDVSITDGDDV